MRQGGAQIHSKPTQHLHLPLSHQWGNLAPDLLGAQRLQSLASGTSWGWISGVYQTASSSRGPVWPGRLHVSLPARLALHRCQPSPAAGGPVGGKLAQLRGTGRHGALGRSPQTGVPPPGAALLPTGAVCVRGVQPLGQAPMMPGAEQRDMLRPQDSPGGFPAAPLLSRWKPHPGSLGVPCRPPGLPPSCHSPTQAGVRAIGSDCFLLSSQQLWRDGVGAPPETGCSVSSMRTGASVCFVKC